MTAEFPTDGKRRRAIVRGIGVGRRLVEAYLPADYSVVEEGKDERGDFVIIEGVDKMGWSMGLYVQPRLASACLSCEELE